MHWYWIALAAWPAASVAVAVAFGKTAKSRNNPTRKESK